MSYLEAEINCLSKKIEREEKHLVEMIIENAEKDNIIKDLQDKIQSKTQEKGTISEKFWKSDNEKQMVKRLSVEITRMQERKQELEKSRTSQTEIDELKRELKEHKQELEENNRKANEDKVWASYPAELKRETKEDFLAKIYGMVEIRDVQNVDYVNILLVGEAGSGKSSFINTCRTAMFNNGALSTKAKVLPSASDSVTKRLYPYPFRNRDGILLPVRLFDCCGLSNGINEDEMKLIIKGYIKPMSYIRSAEEMKKAKEIYRMDPKTKDKMHCIVAVIRADSNFFEDMGHFGKIKNICDYLKLGDCPFVLLTAIDRIGVPNAEMKFIFRHPCVKRICQTVAGKLELPLQNVLPMSNYFEEGLPTPEKDALALMYLWRFITYGKEMLSFDEETSTLPESFNK